MKFVFYKTSFSDENAASKGAVLFETSVYLENVFFNWLLTIHSPV